MTSPGANASMAHPEELFIDGAWVRPHSAGFIDVVDSCAEEPFLRVAAAGPVDVSAAVAAARRAFDSGPWPWLTHQERAAFVRALGDQIRSHAEELGNIWTRQTGILHANSVPVLQHVAGEFDRHADLADTFVFEEEVAPTGGGSYGLLVREPVGVVAAIIPWNSPTAQIACKVAPALLAGCTVVLKASPEAPGEALLIAEMAQRIGLPDGVLNVVTADRDVSELLVCDPRVDKVSFTGSTAAGRKIAGACAERFARCTLELGGKSPALILDDADLGAAAEQIVSDISFLSGQICSALTRIIVSRARQQELTDALVSASRSVVVGDPFEAGVQMGPLVSESQLRIVESYVRQGVAEGARLVTGGGRPTGLDVGYFIAPTVFADVDNRSAIAQEEIFGPVLSVIPAKDEGEILSIAEDTPYGLNASVFTEDTDRAMALARSLRTGTVGHNAFRSDTGVAFGGFKQSGIGREGGSEGLRSYLEVKSVILNSRPEN